MDYPSVPKHKSGLPKRYVGKLSDATASARKKHWEKTEKMSSSNPTAYEPAPGDKTTKTKESKYTKKYKEVYGEEMDIQEEISALRKKADASGISYSTLKKVYDRGMAAWKTGHRPGTTPQQWALARVNSYITKGKTYHTTDKDLREEEMNKEESEVREEIKGWKHAAKDLAKWRSEKGKNVKMVALKKDGNESKLSDATTIHSSEDDAVARHKRMAELNPGKKIRHNLYVDGKLVRTLGEEVEQVDEAYSHLSTAELRQHAEDAIKSGNKQKVRELTQEIKNRIEKKTGKPYVKPDKYSEKTVKDYERITGKKIPTRTEEVEQVDENWIGGISKWKKAVHSKHGESVTYHKKKPTGGTMRSDTIAKNSNGNIVGVYQHNNNMGIVSSRTNEEIERVDEAQTQNKRSVVNRGPQYKSVPSTKAKTKIQKNDYVVHPESGKTSRVIDTNPKTKHATIRTVGGNESTHPWSDLKHYSAYDAIKAKENVKEENMTIIESKSINHKELSKKIDETKTVTNRSKASLMKVNVGGKDHSYKKYGFGLYHPAFGPLKDEKYKSKEEMKAAMEKHPTYNSFIQEEIESIDEAKSLAKGVSHTGKAVFDKSDGKTGMVTSSYSNGSHDVLWRGEKTPQNHDYFYSKKNIRVSTTKDEHKKYVKEEGAANAVGSGKVAGLGVGPQGEPGGKAAIISKALKMIKRKKPNAS